MWCAVVGAAPPTGRAEVPGRQRARTLPAESAKGKRRAQAGPAGPAARARPYDAGVRRLVVLGDSLTWHGPDGPVPLAHPRLYPNIVGGRLADATGAAWDVAVWARAGWGVRELWLGLQKDVHLQQQLLHGADAVVLGLGSVDALSVAVPRWVVMALPYLRPVGLRRRVRRALDRVHPTAVRATRGAWRFTPPDVVRHCWTKSIDAIRLFAPDAALCAVLPAAHRAVYYGAVDRHHAEVHGLLARLAVERAVPVVDLAPLTRRRLDALNPDGAHWGWALHAEVADALARRLLVALGPDDVDERSADDAAAPGGVSAAAATVHRPSHPGAA